MWKDAQRCALPIFNPSSPIFNLFCDVRSMPAECLDTAERLYPGICRTRQAASLIQDCAWRVHCRRGAAADAQWPGAPEPGSQNPARQAAAPGSAVSGYAFRKGAPQRAERLSLYAICKYVASTRDEYPQLLISAGMVEPDRLVGVPSASLAGCLLAMA